MPEQSPDEDLNEAVRSRYIPLLEPLFFPNDPISHDIVRYFSSLLRVVGAEDKGWDPYEESRGIIDDLYALMRSEYVTENAPGKELVRWRLGLLFYCHIVEMDAPYEVFANLLRFRLGKGYSPNPFFEYLTPKEQKRAQKVGLFPVKKIEIIKHLCAEAGLQSASIFDEFYRPALRNAINHSDFIFTDEGFRCRGGHGATGFKISYDELNDILTKAKVFIGTFFGLETEARRFWGTFAGKGLPYDPIYKGIMEVLVDADGLLNGFKVHWPNRSESFYRRTKSGIDMTNCFLDFDAGNLQMMVGLYARRAGTFSPLVEADALPTYTRLEGSSDELRWDAEAAAHRYRPPSNMPGDAPTS
ncbi:MAG TPA: hypothetical protein VGF92_13970 [Stellaceae bacterium]|jgi:hypothetical protein